MSIQRTLFVVAGVSLAIVASAGAKERIMKNFVILLLTLGLTAGAAEAQSRVFDGAVYDVFITDPMAVGDGSENLLSFTLTVVNTTGEPGFDVSVFDGVDFGHTGITGKLHQHYSSIFTPPPLATATLDTTPYATAIDTHFLFVLADLSIIESPSEDISLAPSAEPTDAPPPFDSFADTDFGAYLTGTFAFDPATSLPLAYIVVEADSIVTLNFFLTGTHGGEIISTSFPAPYYEPPNPGDLDSDGDVDADDIDILCMNLGSPDPRYDLDGDGDVDEDDLIFMVENLVELQDGSGRVGTRRGDFNLDGLINATDLAIMKAGFGQSGMGYADGNASCDDIISATDLAILKANYNFQAPTGAVPEPATLLVMAAAGLPLLVKRKRKSRA